MKKYTKAIIIIWSFIVAFNISAWLIPGFSDWYIDHITPVWINTYSRLTGLADFSVGEIMLLLALILLSATVVLTVAAAVIKAVQVLRLHFNASCPGCSCENHSPESPDVQPEKQTDECLESKPEMSEFPGNAAEHEYSSKASGIQPERQACDCLECKPEMSEFPGNAAEHEHSAKPSGIQPEKQTDECLESKPESSEYTGDSTGHRLASGFCRFVVRLLKADLMITTIVCLIMSFNCSVLYKASEIEVNPSAENRQYTVNELFILRNYIAEQCNKYSALIERDSEGNAIYTGDLQAEAKKCMNGISDTYPRLAGFYPNVKPIYFSALMSQMKMAGYYFPFSLEANVNSYMYITNYPACFCHELAHLHGYIFEDEANFISYLACIKSEDDFFVYSGYLHAINYVVNACAQYEDSLSDEAKDRIVRTNETVDRDNIFLTDEMWKKVNSESSLSTESVSQASRTFTDTVLKVNGVEDGIASYNRIVELLLRYYDGILYN